MYWLVLLSLMLANPDTDTLDRIRAALQTLAARHGWHMADGTLAAPGQPEP